VDIDKQESAVMTALARKWLIGVSSLVMALATTILAQAYEAGPVTGGGTIEGKVIFNGAVETRKIIPNKDLDVCDGPRDEPLIEVGPDKGVQNAVVYLVEVAKGKAWPAEAQQVKTPELVNHNCRFEPHVQVIRAGPLEVVNDDPMLHNTHGYYGKRTAFNMALPNEGQRIPTELTRAGTVRIDCDAHGWMEGWIYVVDNPYYAITGADGKFSITDVPPGNYTLVAIQSLTGPVQQPVNVAAGKPTELTIELKKQ
jgi:plastocyanin